MIAINDKNYLGQIFLMNLHRISDKAFNLQSLTIAFLSAG
jgi:hypothetical protein